MPGILNNATLRGLSFTDLALHLRDAAQQHSAKAISVHLLSAIEQQAIVPLVFQIFLTAVEISPLIGALTQEHSKHVRYIAIREFGRRFRSARWHLAWQEVGGTPGLLTLLAQMSVIEVKHFCKAIGHCSRQTEIGKGERQERVQELLQSLLPGVYPDILYKTTDERPLHRRYAQLIPACSSQFVDSLLCKDSHLLQDSLPTKSILKHHPETLRRLALDTIVCKSPLNGSAANRFLEQYLPSLLQSVPTLPGTEPGFSASMSFSTTVLQQLVSQEMVICLRNLSGELLNPLLRRLRVHKVDQHRVRNVLEHAVQYYERHRDTAKRELSLDRAGVIFDVATYWSEAPAIFETQLVRLVETCRPADPLELYRPFSNLFSGSVEYRSRVCILGAVKSSAKYDLFRLLCRHFLRHDIESDRALQDTQIRIWPSYVFLEVDQKHGLALLQRLICARPDGDFLERDDGISILSQAPTPDRSHGDPRLLLTILQRDTADGLTNAQSTVEELKLKAATSRDHDDRAFFAKSTVLYAIASGSLEIYHTVVLWLRRFLGDFKVVKTVNAMAACNTKEGILLLSGIPDRLDGIGTQDIREYILRSNTILMDILESAVMSLRQPSFLSADWTYPLALIRHVVMIRVSQAGKLKRCHKLSEDDLFGVVWAPTLEMLVAAEKVGIVSEHAGLSFGSPNGPLTFAWTGGKQKVKPGLPSTYRFLDHMAKTRDELWRRHRPTQYPAVAALQPPFPQGLPIQCLTGQPYDLASDAAASHTPFLAERAKNVVMIDRDLALGKAPVEEEMRTAIGRFVDHFDTALALYVLQQPEGKEREAAISRASSHALNELSRGRLSGDEAQLFWRRVFKETLRSNLNIPPLTDPRSLEPSPIIPTDTEPLKPTEWNPDGLATQAIESRRLEPTAIDCLLYAPVNIGGRSQQTLVVPDSKTVGASSPSMWDWGRLAKPQKVPIPIREAMIIAALLFESSKIGSLSRLLASPFPSNDDVRYPTMFLDEDFLQASDKKHAQPTNMLLHFLTLVPPTLLHDLTNAALDKLWGSTPTDKDIANKTTRAYQLLKALCGSDRPQLAIDLVLRSILERPEDSSWHRQLLGKSLVRNLSNNQTQALLSSFALSICEKLASQNRTQERKSKDSDKTTKPLVKVTTVKFLAQFLDDADFVSPGFSVDILSMLFDKATHIDIRTAVVDSVIGRLAQCGDSSGHLITRLLSALEATVPIIGSLNERNPPQESHWTEAEQKRKLPKVYSDGRGECLPPILNTIANALMYRRISSTEHRRFLIDRVLIPGINRSKSENARWVSLFLSKHAKQQKQPPSFPVKPEVLAQIVECCYNELPSSALDLYHQYFLTITAPTNEIAAFTTKIKDSVSLRDSNEGKHWLSLFTRKQDFSYNVLPRLITFPWKPSQLPENGTELAHVQDLVFEQATTLLHVHDVNFTHWTDYLAVLEPPTHYQHQDNKNAWVENCKPVLSRIITHIESIRTPEWQRDPNRHPAILPDTFWTKLWLLPYPHLPLSIQASGSDSELFAREILAALREIVELGIANYEKFRQLKTALKRCEPEKKVEVALCIDRGAEHEHDSSDHGDLGDYPLRIELADTLLESVKTSRETDQQIYEHAKGLIERWKGNSDEGVRMRGWRLGEKLGTEGRLNK